MQLQHLKPNHKPESKKRIGRGGKKGSTSGRGTKGQKARAGKRMKPLIRGFIKRYPKLRGHRMESWPASLVGVNLDKIERHFQAGETVNPRVLIEKKIIFFPGNKIPLRCAGSFEGGFFLKINYQNVNFLTFGISISSKTFVQPYIGTEYFGDIRAA